MEIIHRLAENPALCMLVSGILGLWGIMGLRGMLTDLLKMHRTKASMKKIYQTYPLMDRLRLRHIADNCLHAKSFCNTLITVHDAYCVLLLVSLLAGAMTLYADAARLLASVTVIKLLLLDLPVHLMLTVLKEEPMGKHSRWRFRKYQNTRDYYSLF